MPFIVSLDYILPKPRNDNGQRTQLRSTYHRARSRTVQVNYTYCVLSQSIYQYILKHPIVY